MSSGTTPGFNGNQPARRALACKLIALSEYEGKPIGDFGDALVAINADFEMLRDADIEDLWERWTAVHDALLIETDERERLRLQFMLALVGTKINELR